jgi:hypothetical protein
MIVPSPSAATNLAFCTARQWSRAGVTPHGPNYDCRLRGSAADTQSTKPEKVAIRCDNIGAKQKRD